MKKSLLPAVTILLFILIAIGVNAQHKEETKVHMKVIKNGVTETDSLFTIQGGHDSDELKKIIYKYSGIKADIIIDQTTAKKEGKKKEMSVRMKHEMDEHMEHAGEKEVRKIVIKKGDEEDHVVIMNNEEVADLNNLDELEWISVDGDSIHIKHQGAHKVVYIGEGEELNEEMKKKLKELETIDIKKDDDMVIIKGKKGEEEFVWTTISKEGDEEKKVIKEKIVETYVISESEEGEETRVKVYTKPGKGEKSSNVVIVTGDEGEIKMGDEKTKYVVKTKKKKGEDDEIEITVTVDDKMEGEASYDIMVMADDYDKESIQRKVKISNNMKDDLLEVVIEITEGEGATKEKMKKKKKKEVKK